MSRSAISTTRNSQPLSSNGNDVIASDKRYNTRGAGSLSHPPTFPVTDIRSTGIPILASSDQESAGPLRSERSVPITSVEVANTSSRDISPSTGQPSPLLRPRNSTRAPARFDPPPSAPQVRAKKGKRARRNQATSSRRAHFRAEHLSPASRVSFRNPLASLPAGSSLPTEVASDEDIDLNSGSEFHEVSQSSTGVYPVSPGHDPVVPLDH